MGLITATLALVAALINSQQAINEAPQPEQATEEVTYEGDYLEQPEEAQQAGQAYEAEGYVEEAEYAEPAPVYSAGLTAQSGVNYHDGRTESGCLPGVTDYYVNW